MSGSIAGVTQAVSTMGAAATKLPGAAGELAKQAETLSGKVADFLDEVRDAQDRAACYSAT